MPYEIRKVDNGWKVFTRGTARSHSDSPLPLKRAKQQLKALYANANDVGGGMVGGFDDGDWRALFVGGGQQGEADEERAQSRADAQEVVRLDKGDATAFDVEEATDEPQYLKQAKANARKAGYKDASSLRLADDGKHKLVLRGVKFGSMNSNDYIIYKQHFPSIADKKRRQYLARACKIKGDWAKDPYSANSLAINILWDGATAGCAAEEMKEAKQILHKVAGEGNPEVKAISETPMGDDNIRKYFPNAKILKYSELAGIHDITQLLPAPSTFFFLLYEHALNSGHWVAVNRYINNGKDTICFFCSYGSRIDAPLYWNSQGRNKELGQDRPYLSQLLQKSVGETIEYNKVQYQSKRSPVATCGAFAVLWIKANLRDNMNLQDFHEWIADIKSETGLSYDAIASNAISSRTF